MGVVAVDPTSPFSGGAILGDRIRMQRHATDEGVFIRSLATRGHFGGLTASARAVLTVLDAMGKDYLLVETVGVGQDEVEIAATAYTTLVVTVPGLGDDIQALKAGLLEVADLLVVNKADREGAERTYQDLLTMLDLRFGKETPAWMPKHKQSAWLQGSGYRWGRYSPYPCRVSETSGPNSAWRRAPDTRERRFTDHRTNRRLCLFHPPLP